MYCEWFRVWYQFWLHYDLEKYYETKYHLQISWKKSKDMDHNIVWHISSAKTFHKSRFQNLDRSSWCKVTSEETGVQLNSMHLHFCYLFFVYCFYDFGDFEFGRCRWKTSLFTAGQAGQCRSSGLGNTFGDGFTGTFDDNFNDTVDDHTDRARQGWAWWW